MTITKIQIHQASLPLEKPYSSALGTVENLDTVLVEIHDTDGTVAWGEAAIYPGYASETVEQAWRLWREEGNRVIGKQTREAKLQFEPFVSTQPHAVTALVSALEMLEAHPVLQPPQTDIRIALLEPVHAKTETAINTEVEELIEQGYKTLKLKIGYDVDEDLQRIKWVLNAIDGRAVLRMDANQGYCRNDACRVASQLEPEGIELFEQPCAAGDWEAAEAVAQVSNVPLMMDESIYGIDDILETKKRQCAEFIKTKLVKCGGIDKLIETLRMVRTQGMKPILGNGVATELGCWMEALAGHNEIDLAGEMNGYLKPKARLFRQALGFEHGELVIPAGFIPEIDRDVLAEHTIYQETLR